MRMRGLFRDGEYLVIAVLHGENYWDLFNKEFFGKGEKNDLVALHKACRNLLIIQSTMPHGRPYSDFVKKVIEYNMKEPFNFPPGITQFLRHITIYASYLFDAVIVYAEAATELIRKNVNIRDGHAVIQEIKGRERYTSIAGVDMTINKNGDVEGNYTVLALLPVLSEQARNTRDQIASLPGIMNYTELMQPMGIFKYVNQSGVVFEQNVSSTLLWKNGRPPVAVPPCGYDGEACIAGYDEHRKIAAGVLAFLLLLVSVCTTVVYRNWKYEQEIDGLLWMIDKSELEPVESFYGPKHGMSKMSLVSQIMSDSARMMNLANAYRYRGTIAFAKKLVYLRRSADIPRKNKKEMKVMRELHHGNINPFIGACVEPNCIYTITEFCAKGNLQDILENDVIRLDNMFIASFVFDLIKGLQYLHESDLKVHGNLKSTNCLVTSLWVVRLSDFGLHELRTANETARSIKEEYKDFRRLLWRSPEVLRSPSAYQCGSQKDDIYAFGIILHEIIGRQGPWGPCELEPCTIIDCVKKDPGTDEPFRPPVADLECQDYVLNVMRDCWAEKIEARPELGHIRERLKQMRQGMKPNIMDNMMSMMEKYANNLEDLVNERTCLLQEEKKKTEALLHRMLPKSVASQLMRRKMVVPESFDSVTIYFSDIVGFTEMSASSKPIQVVNFLNDLYTCFDSIIQRYDVYKVETIGDAYMVVSGLPIRNGDSHAKEIASMALELLDAVRNFRIRHRPEATLRLRIGIHTGPVVAGVVGLTMPRYCLFGDTVNTASRMESNGEALKIHISSQCRDLLEKIGGYEIADRGLIKMKGKGELRTYWLLGHTTGPQPRRRPTQPPPQPLFGDPNGPQHRSPKSEALPRRGSLIPKLPESDLDCSGLGLMNGSVVGGIQAIHRLRQESPGLRSKRAKSPSRNPSFTCHSPQSIEEYLSSRASSTVDLDGGMLQVPPDSLRHNERQPSDCGCSDTDISASRSASRQWLDRGKNGLKSLDESAQPLLINLDGSPNCNGNSLLSAPDDGTKRWRSCDEISTKPPRLKKVFPGLWKKGLPDDTSQNGNRGSSMMNDEGCCDPRFIYDEENSESVV
ncbi:receptor-type guanylate cyclase Gyc76C-like isoform X2 [Ornithodoros turicata]